MFAAMRDRGAEVNIAGQGKENRRSKNQAAVSMGWF